MQCHTRASNRSLGIEALQLDDDYEYSTGRTANQLMTLQHIGIVDGEAPSGVVGMPALTGDAPVEQRARAYLHANCSMCHRPSATGGGAGDLRYSVSDPNLCNVEPERGDLGVAEAKLVVPGHPEQSVVPLRMRSTERERMPPVSSLVVDDEGVALIEEWIDSLETCP
jgi:mono/diheme cytochrome c family protein